MSNRMSYQAYASLKKNLPLNLKAVRDLDNKEGAKLLFDKGQGRFHQESDDDARGKRNDKKPSEDDKDSATSSVMFEQPLLVTFYECKRLKFKDLTLGKDQAVGVNPDTDFQAGVKGLTYLRDVTYTKQWFKGDQREAITNLLGKLQKFKDAATRSALDAWLLKYVQLALPDTLSQFVRLAAGDGEIKQLIKNELSHYGGSQKVAEDKLEDFCVKSTRKTIYNKYYKTGGSGKSQVPDNLNEGQYEKNITTLVTRYPKMTGRGLIDGYYFFDVSGYSADVNARVYIHLQADTAGQKALEALKLLFDNVSSGNAIEESTRSKIVKFKIGTLAVLHEGKDSVVIYLKTYEGAKKLAEALSGPLQRYTAQGLPGMVKPVSQNQGIGVATEPEIPLKNQKSGVDDWAVKLGLQEEYSYGLHRSEIIARGLLVAAIHNHDTVPTDLTPCYNAVAMKFQQYGMHPFKPHKPSTVAPVQGS